MRAHQAAQFHAADLHVDAGGFQCLVSLFFELCATGSQLGSGGFELFFGFSKAGLGQASAVMLTIVLVLMTRVVTYFFRKSEVEA